MTVPMFLALLFGFSVITGLIVEAIKKFVNDTENVSYNIIALVVALVAMVGYDKVCQAITQLTSGKVPEVDTSTEE